MTVKTVYALEPTSQIFVKNGFSSYFLHKTSNICYDEKWSLYGQIHFYKFFSAIFCIVTPKSHKTNNFNSKFEWRGLLDSLSITIR